MIGFESNLKRPLNRLALLGESPYISTSQDICLAPKSGLEHTQIPDGESLLLEGRNAERSSTRTCGTVIDYLRMCGVMCEHTRDKSDPRSIMERREADGN
jgi:hypothetical protein